MPRGHEHNPLYSLSIRNMIFHRLYYYMRNFCNLIGLEHDLYVIFGINTTP